MLRPLTSSNSVPREPGGRSEVVATLAEDDTRPLIWEPATDACKGCGADSRVSDRARVAITRRSPVPAFFAAITLLSASAGPGSAGTLAETIKRVKPSVVGVGTYQAVRRPSQLLLGTGFVVADGHHVVTNFHVVDRRGSGVGKERLSIFVGAGNRVKAIPVEVVAKDPEHDVAILKFMSEAMPPLPMRGEASVEEGQRVAFTGFPIGTVYGLHAVTHRGIVSAVTPVAIPQMSSRLLDPVMIQRLKQRFEVYQLDATAYPGNSGSPVFDPETGEVLAIISSTFVKRTRENMLRDPSAITFAVPIEYARRLLREQKIDD